MYCIVSTYSKTFDEIGLTYFIPDFLRWKIKKWQLVQIPLKDKIEDAIVLDILKKENSNIDKNKIKSLINIKNNNVLIKDYQLELISWISRYYFTAIHNSLNLTIPRNTKDKLSKEKLNLEKTKKYNYSYKKEKKLSQKQEKAYKQIKNSNNRNILFHWITWSWKTEIYIKLIKNNLDSWKQSLLLIPEIILWNQIWDKIKKVFWEEVIIINSSITEATKTKYWIDIHSGNAKIIVWTRSAMFYPYENLWLIIIDEEHDNSYISDNSPRYKTNEVVRKISELLKIKVILASWTPSIKTMYEAMKGKYELVSLLEKWK